MSSSGPSKGGIIGFNTDGSNRFNLTADTSLPVLARATARTNLSTHRWGRTRSPLPPTGTGSRIIVMNGDGTGLQQLTTNPGRLPNSNALPEDINPVISPDGSKVAFIANRSEAGTSPNNPGFFADFDDIYIVNTDGTGLQKVTSTQANRSTGGFGSKLVSVAWKPDSSQLVFRGVRLATVNGQEGFHQVMVLSTLMGPTSRFSRYSIQADNPRP